MDWIKDLFKNLGQFLLNAFNKVIDFFSSIYDDVVDFFKYIADSLSKVLSWFESLFDSFLDKVGVWIAAIVDMIPNLQGYYTSFYQNYGKQIYLCNQWINLELAFTLLGAYLAIWLIFVTIKFTLKLIPTIG